MTRLDPESPDLAAVGQRPDPDVAEVARNEELVPGPNAYESPM